MFEKLTIPPELIPSDPRFGCGPSLVPMEFVQGLLEKGSELIGTSHRKPPVKNLVKGIQEGLSQYFSLDENHFVVVGNGGATFLFDMIGLGLVEKEITHFTCGEFSEKWYKSSHAIPWIKAHNNSADYGLTPSYDNSNYADSDVVCVTLNETSTGVQFEGLPPIKNANTLLAVDATSGAGQIPCDVNQTDVFFFSPQKVFASEGGLFVCILSKAALERALKINADSNRYIPGIMNWKTAIDNSEKNQTYNTPAVSTLYFLNEQIKKMNKLGYAEVCAAASAKADIVYNWALSKEYLSPYVEAKSMRSLSVATINVDESIDVAALLINLHNQKIVYGIESYRKLGKNQFRISLFHNVSKEDILKLTQLLSYAIEGRDQ